VSVDKQRPSPAIWWFVAALLVVGGAALFVGEGAVAQPEDPRVVAVERWLPSSTGGLKRVTVFIDTDLADPEALVAAAYPGSSSAPTVSAQFVTFARWEPEDIPVPVGYDPTHDPPGISGQPVLVKAGNTWNNVPGHSFAFTFGGPVGADTPTCGPNEADGANTVLFSSDLAFGVLGETCTFFPAFMTSRIVEFDISLSSTTPWSTALITPNDAFDLETVILHELGHALGLDHSSDGTVMQPFLEAGAQIRIPTADDIAGIQFLYGNTPTPTPQTPSATPETPSPTPETPNPTSETPNPTPATPGPSPTPTPPTVHRAILSSLARD
jgi:hypothetical protein